MEKRFSFGSELLNFENWSGVELPANKGFVAVLPWSDLPDLETDDTEYRYLVESLKNEQGKAGIDWHGLIMNPGSLRDLCQGITTVDDLGKMREKLESMLTVGFQCQLRVVLDNEVPVYSTELPVHKEAFMVKDMKLTNKEHEWIESEEIECVLVQRDGSISLDGFCMWRSLAWAMYEASKRISINGIAMNSSLFNQFEQFRPTADQMNIITNEGKKAWDNTPFYDALGEMLEEKMGSWPILYHGPDVQAFGAPSLF
jgi:hypothetical protein